MHVPGVYIMGPRYLVPKKCTNLQKKNPFKNFQIFWPKIFTWLWRYSKILFGAKFWGAVCAPTRHICGFPILAPKWRFWAKSAEISGCATWVHPTPKFFGAPKVMTPRYIQHKYLSVTRKTRRDTLLQNLLIFTLCFCVPCWYMLPKGVFPIGSQMRMQEWPKFNLS